MTTQPLKQILEQANLPWSEKLNDEWLFLDKDGNRIARADSIYHDDRTLILHSVNNLSRAIEALSLARKTLCDAKQAWGGCDDTIDEIDKVLASLETVQTP